MTNKELSKLKQGDVVVEVGIHGNFTLKRFHSYRDSGYVDCYLHFDMRTEHLVISKSENIITLEQMFKAIDRENRVIQKIKDIS